MGGPWSGVYLHGHAGKGFRKCVPKNGWSLVSVSVNTFKIWLSWGILASLMSSSAWSQVCFEHVWVKWSYEKGVWEKIFLSVNHCRTICVPVEMGFMWPAVYHVAVFYHRSYCLDIIWSVPEQSRVAVVVCCCWLFLYSAVIHSQANLLCSCRIWF